MIIILLCSSSVYSLSLHSTQKATRQTGPCIYVMKLLCICFIILYYEFQTFLFYLKELWGRGGNDGSVKGCFPGGNFGLWPLDEDLTVEIDGLYDRWGVIGEI